MPRMGTVDVSPENVMPDRRRGRSGRSWGERDEIFVRKIIILLLLINGHDALLAVAGGRARNLRRAGRKRCGGDWDGREWGREGRRMEGSGAECGERDANETRRPRNLRRRRRIGRAGRARRFSPSVVLEIDGRHRPSLPVGEVRTGRDLAGYPPDLYKSIHKSHQLL